MKNQSSDLNYSRKGYRAFDVSGIPNGFSVSSATLTLTLAGTAGSDPAPTQNWVYEVFGLTDESLDGWGETTINWNNAPANQNNSSGFDPTKITTSLGTITINGTGTVGTTYSISSPALANFINSDTNNTVTFLIRRVTDQPNDANNLFDQFASGENSTLSGPQLTMNVISEPTSLVAFGLAGFFGARFVRRRKVST